MPAQKVESVMRQCLNCCFNKKQLLRKRKFSEVDLTDFSDMEICPEALELVQVAATEFISFITSDAIDNVMTGNRVAIKEQDVLESLESLGFEDYIQVIETHQRVVKKEEV